MKKQPKHPCVGCIYFKACGNSGRTMPCEGRETKSGKREEGVYMMDEYTREFLCGYGNYILEPGSMTERRKPRNGIEAEGALWMASKWIEENIPEETMQGAYDNFTGLRTDVNGNGRFDTYEFFELYDIKELLKISGIILSGECVYLEVWNTQLDKVVAYIGIN